MRSLRTLISGPYAITGASIGAAALGNVVCYKLMAVLGSSHAFSDYSTARRYLAFALPFAGLGIGVALPLRSAMRPDRDESRRILYAQFVGAAVVVIVALGFVLLGSSFSGILPGLSDREVIAVLVTVFAFNCTGMLYAYFRGFQDFRRGAALVVLANGVFPAVGALFAANGAAIALWIWACLCLALAVFTVGRLGWPGWGPVSDLPALLRSSLGRVPGELAYAAVFMLPVAQMQGLGSPGRESVFNYFFVILGIITAAAAPLSSVFLPVVGARVAQGGTGPVRALLTGSVCAGFLVGLGVWAVVSVAPSMILRVFMSEEFVPYSAVLTSLGPAALGLALFVFVRSVLDGMGEIPVTASVSLVALAAYLVTRILSNSSIESSIVLASNVAMSTLGFGTLVCALLMFRLGNRQVVSPAPEAGGPI